LKFVLVVAGIGMAWRGRAWLGLARRGIAWQGKGITTTGATKWQQ